MLTVENGTGLANADSYVSVEEADAYHASRGNVLWADILPAQKEVLLRRATDYITYIFGRSFIGVRAVSGQSLAWPRISINDINLYSLGVPREIREATAELALVANTAPLMPNQTTVRKKMVKVGPIQVEYDAGAWTGNRFVSATARLSAFIEGQSSGMTARLVRT
jgi:hypothetical protein